MRNFNVIILIGPIQNGVCGIFPGERGFRKSLSHILTPGSLNLMP